MTLVRWNPFREVGDWDRSIDRLFDGIFPHVMEKESRRASAWSPTVDVAENGDSLVFSVELPGFAKDGVDISFDDGITTGWRQSCAARGEEEVRTKTPQAVATTFWASSYRMKWQLRAVVVGAIERFASDSAYQVRF